VKPKKAKVKTTMKPEPTQAASERAASEPQWSALARMK
jgi:hypothetical protein